MRLVIFDISGMAYATWKATGHKSINEMYTRVLNGVRAHLMGDKFDRVVIACDSPGNKFRHDIDPNYKGTRELPDEGYIGQLRDLVEMLEGDGCHVLKKDGYEADDIIATVVEWARAEGMVSVEIASNDKDFGCLVYDAKGEQETPVTLWKASRNQDGSVSSRAWTEDDVKKKWGVSPGQMTDFLALCGDTSDNIKGVEGVGPKSAAKLLAKHGNLEGITDAIVNRATEFTPALAENLRASRAHGKGMVAGLARDLVTLATDALTHEECSVILTKKEPRTMTKETDKKRFVDEPDVPEPSEPGGETPAVIDGELEAIATVDSSPSPAPMVVRDVSFERELEPHTHHGLWELTEAIHDSRLFGGYGNREAILVTAILGRSLGLDIMSALRGIHVVKGKPVMSAQLMLGLIHRSGKAQYFQLLESSYEIATYETHRKGDPKPVKMSFSMEDCHRAKLGLSKQTGKWDENSNWAKYTRDMLRWRAVAQLGRAIYPDVLSNCYTPDEEGEIR